jgi:hypothetical protein
MLLRMENFGRSDSMVVDAGVIEGNRTFVSFLFNDHAETIFPNRSCLRIASRSASILADN